MHKRMVDSNHKQPDRLYTILTSKQQRDDLQRRARGNNKNNKQQHKHVTEEDKNGTNMKGERKKANRKERSPNRKT